MKKIIIISTTIVTIAIVILALFISKKTNDEVISISPIKQFDLIDMDYDAAYSDLPESNGSVKSLANSVASKIKLQRKYSDYTKKTMLSSNIPNVTNEQIMEALKTLVNDNSGTNNYDPNTSQFKMEFELNNVPKITQSKYADGNDYYAYRLDYENIKPDEDYAHANPNNIDIIANNTFINQSMARYFSVSIYMNYETDENYHNRKRSAEHIANVAENEEAMDRMMAKLTEEYPPRTKFTQGVNFLMRNIKFDTKLNVPSTINIWNENSSELFPCHLYSNELIKGYSDYSDIANANANDYSLKYYCLKLPNYNDYNGDLKILFD